MSPQKLVYIGAAGEMAGPAVRALAETHPDLEMLLADINMERLKALAATLPNPERLTLGQVDLFNPEALAESLKGATLVVNGAGPYYRTAEPVLQACIAAGVDYMDYADDAEASLGALALKDEVEAAGIGAFVGVGLSPGYLNILAVDAASELDTVESIDLDWYIGDEGKYRWGEGAIDHWIHAISGEALSWQGGKRVSVPAYVETRLAEFADRSVRLYECGHPEVVTLPLKYPQADSIRIFGGVAYGTANGICKGLGEAVTNGELTPTEARDFLIDLFDDEPPLVKGWQYAMRAVAEQVEKGEVSEEETRAVLAGIFAAEHEPYTSGWSARVTGLKNGERTTVVRRNPVAGPDTVMWVSITEGTGLCVAAGAHMLLEGGKPGNGVFFPETWIQPEAFYGALAAVGIPESEIVDNAPTLVS